MVSPRNLALAPFLLSSMTLSVLVSPFPPAQSLPPLQNPLPPPSSPLTLRPIRVQVGASPGVHNPRPWHQKAHPLARRRPARRGGQDQEPRGQVGREGVADEIRELGKSRSESFWGAEETSGKREDARRNEDSRRVAHLPSFPLVSSTRSCLPTLQLFRKLNAKIVPWLIHVPKQ